MCWIRLLKDQVMEWLKWSQANEEASNNNLNYDTSTFLDADGYTMLNANDSATLIAYFTRWDRDYVEDGS